jgi:hypothetical protein
MTQRQDQRAAPAHNVSCPFKVGELVMFKNRCQFTSGGMPVQAVDANMFDVRIQVGGLWWTPECFIRHSEWLALSR